MSSSALTQIANALQNGIGLDLNLTGYTWASPDVIGQTTPNSSFFTQLSTIIMNTSSLTINGGLQDTPVGTAQSNVANFTSAAISSLTANAIAGPIGTQTSNVGNFTALAASSITANYFSAPQALFSSIGALNVVGPVGLNTSNTGNFTALAASSITANYFSAPQALFSSISALSVLAPIGTATSSNTANFTSLNFSTGIANRLTLSTLEASTITSLSNSTTTMLVSSIQANAILSRTLSTGTTTAGILNTLAISTGSITASSIVGPIGMFAGTSNTAAFTNVNVSTITSANGITNTGTTAVQQIIETMTVRSTLTGTVTHDWFSSAVWYHSSMTTNISCAVTNLPTTANRSLVVSLILNQGATPYYASTLTVNGTLTPIRWATGTTPTPAANKIEVESFTLFYVGTTWTALGQYTSFG